MELLPGMPITFTPASKASMMFLMPTEKIRTISMSRKRAKVFLHAGRKAMGAGDVKHMN